jgi:hypothetical protein
VNEIITCKKCGGPEFYKDGRCKICRAAEGKKYYVKDHEKINAQHKKYRDEHHEELNARARRNYAQNPEKTLAKIKEYRAKNPEKVCARDRKYRDEHGKEISACNKEYRQEYPEKVRASRLMCLYGISVEQYSEMLAKQNGVCAICGSVPGGRRLCIDHNHETGEIRGLLCDKCNRALGMLTTTDLLAKAQDYLLTASHPQPF